MKNLLLALTLLLASIIPVSAASVLVYWNPSTDTGGSGLAGYKIYRGGSLIGTSAVTYYTDTTAASNTSYSYTVAAYDNAGNTSAQSATVSVTSGPGTNRNVTCSGDITSALTTAIGSSSNGDQVTIGAGSCSTTSAITFTNKNIVIRGAGQGITNITTGVGAGFLVPTFTGTNSPQFRLSGFSLSSAAGNSGSQHPVWLWCSNYNVPDYRGPFRIDHVDFNYPTSGGLLSIYGPCFGAIDHNTFTGAFEHAIWVGLLLDSEDGLTAQTSLGSWAAGALPYQPGNANYLYIEDNTFVGADTTQVWSIIDTNYSGGRSVIRHNTVTNGMMYAHWTSHGNINSEWLEVYNNKFDAGTPTAVPYPGRMQGGGTGLIYNNTFVHYSASAFTLGEQRATGVNSLPPIAFCDGTHDWDGNAGDTNAPGWPCLMQTGRAAGVTVSDIIAGIKQPSFPIYLWNNGPQDKCYNPAAAGAACDNTFTIGIADATALKYFFGGPFNNPGGHNVTGGGYGQGDVEFSITTSQPAGAGHHTLVYTPYVYPHPLTTIP